MNIELDGVQDTLFIPLMARMYISKTFPEYFYDKKAIEIANMLPSNLITEKSSEYSMVTSASRSIVIDDFTKIFIEKHKKSNIVCIGCGFETTSWRLSDYKTKAHFYEIDFDDVVNQRKQILGTLENETLISGDINILNLHEYIDCSLPTFFVVSGVFEYFKEHEVLSVIKKLQSDFKNAEIIFDAVSSFGLKYANRYVKKTGNKNAIMYLSINNGEDFAKLSHTKLLKQSTVFHKVTKQLKKKLKLYTRISLFINDYKQTSMILHLAL